MEKTEVKGHEAHMQKAKNLGIQDEVNRPIKIVFLGSGSAFFKNLFCDVMSIPGAAEGEMALVDIDPKRLELSRRLGEKILEKKQLKGWKVTATTKRLEVLQGADYIINCIEVSGTECVRFDNDIPLEYGVDQCIGDTIGPGGLFKALRTVPVFLEVLKDIERLCPNAWILNYTNPMSIMCLSANRASSAKVIGLCHSVQGTSHQLAKYAGIPYEEMKWRCAGINHLAWFTELTHNGKDLYPVLKRKIGKDPELLAQDPVRFDLMKYFDYFVTESSGHFSEYLPYYRKRKELIAKHCGEKYLGQSSFYADEWPGWRIDNDERRKKFISGEEEIDLARTWEYASFIIQAMETNSPFKIYGTVKNTGLITNLPQNNVVEVACTVDSEGIVPNYFGELPAHLAALCAANQYMFDVAADACIHRSKDLAMKALMLDPLTAAVCSPAEIKEMTMRLFDAEKKFLPGFK
ncbi:MAG: alpha-galactosidase [Victivallaceae bacterium]|nr:alpha-galactosidase [Victivallaceae bacterium]